MIICDHSHSPDRPLRTNAAWAVLANIIYAAGRFFLFIMLAKYLLPLQVGRFDLAIAIVAPLALLFDMSLRLVLVTDAQSRIDAGNCLSTRFLTSLLLGLVLLIVCFCKGSSWGWHKNAVILLVGAVRIAEGFADIYLAVLQKHEQMKYNAVSQALKMGLLFIWLLVIVPLWPDILFVLLGWLLTTLAVTFIYDRRLAGRFSPLNLRWNLSDSCKLIKLSLPLGMFVTLSTFNDKLPRYFIEPALGDAAVGYFASLWYFVVALVLLQNGVNQSVLPRLSQFYQSDRPAFRRLLLKILVLTWLAAAALLVIVWWKGRLILQILYQPVYAEQFYGPQQTGSVSLFVVAMLAAAILLTEMVLGDAIVACRRYRTRMAATALALVVNVLICWQYVGTHGLSAAIWAAVASAAAGLLVCGLALGAALRH